MRTYSEETLLAFCRAWPWVVSDRVGEFDDVLHRPLRAPSRVQARTVEFIEKRSLLSPSDPASKRAQLFEELLRDVSAYDENVDRIYDWARSLSSHMQPAYSRRALGIWQETFERFSRGQRAPARYISEELMEMLCETFLASAYKPGLEFSLRVRTTSEAWLDDYRRRTDFDNDLWDDTFEATDVDPAMIASLGYRQVLVREWWRAARRTLTVEQLHGLRREQIENTTTFAGSNPPDWKLDESITEAMVVEGFPPFDSLRVDPA